ncbi:MAG: PAS domain S-box protein, partial [Candidatus Latescibacterota bacterium]
MTKRRTNQNRPDPKRNPIEIEAAAGSGPAGPAPEREGPFDGKDWLRLLYENARIGIAIVRLDGTFLSANPAACRILGYREEQIAGKTFASITHPDDVEISLAHFRKLVAGECESYDLIKRYLHKDGRDVDALITVSLVRDDAGRPRYVLAQVEDLSRQRRITKELRETEIHYRSLFENMLNGLAYCRVIYEEGRPVDFV